MTDNSHEKEKWEARINALLDGELDPNESEDLKWAATNDQDLARAIVEAYQLQRAMEHVHVEKAPASLSRRLKKIPGQNRPVFLQPRWAMAFAVVPLMVISIALLRSTEAPVEQSVDQQAAIEAPGIDPVKAEQAMQDLAIAFAYIDQVSDRTSNRIEFELGNEMSQAVAGSIFKSIQHQKIL
jgi:anti-sigma factor RsiW